jgi:hypothetical protein
MRIFPNSDHITNAPPTTPTSNSGQNIATPKATDQVVIDLTSSQFHPPPPTDPLRWPINDGIQRTYGHNSKPKVTENDLVDGIEKLKDAKLFSNLIGRASLKRQLAEMKAHDRNAIAPLIFSAYLLNAASLVETNTFESIREIWRPKIAEARPTLEAFASQHQITLGKPASKEDADLPAPKDDEYPKINRIVSSIFAALALIFSLTLYYILKKRRSWFF